jgi:predicted enzyme related to lactoylglutathione lyase
MPARTAYTPGTPCWVDVFTPDPEAAQRFYGSVFGWTPGASPGPGYRYLLHEGAVVAGSGQLTEEQMQRGMPPSWSMHVRVTEVDASVERALELGASVATEAFTVDGVGRLAVLSDPQGAIFLLWEPRGFAGAEVVNEVGAWAWNDLQTADPAAAAPFYEALFGWTIAEAPGADGAYFTISHEGRSIGGLMRADRPIDHPYWTVYIGTDDVEAALQRIADAGGRPLAGPISVPAGRFAVALDDQGATLCLVESAFDD